MKNALYFWLAAGGVSSGLVWGEGSGNPTWDNEAEDFAGNPDSSFHSDDNWNPDAVPGATDDVCILEHTDAGNPVFLSSTSATLQSLVCKVPFRLGETLILSAASEFENSLLAASGGRIRTSGVVTFKGNNDLSGVTLEGTGGYFNEGKAVVGSRGITTTFINQDEVTMVAALSGMGDFENNGLLNLGEKGHVNSSSKLTNFGTIKKDDDTADSFISADLFMKDGLIEVAAGNALEITGLKQEFEGGALQVDGELLLSNTVGGVDFVRVFNGLPEITGEGEVNMTRAYEIQNDLSNKLMNAPGLVPFDLNFGKAPPEAQSATLTNNGYLTLIGSPDLWLADENDSGSLFKNAGDGTVEQLTTSNPSFRVPVLNEGMWTASSMRMNDFTNRKTVLLKGDRRIDPSDTSRPAVFRNEGNGEVVMPNDGEFHRYRVTTAYNQTFQAKTLLDGGILILQGGSTDWGSLFEISASSELRVETGQFEITDLLVFAGEGKMTIGGSQLNPLIKLSDSAEQPGIYEMMFRLGGSEESFDTSKGVDFKSGTLDLGGVEAENRGYFKWGGGRIDTGEFTNKGRMDISSGVPRRLTATLYNLAGGEFGGPGGLFQGSSIFMETNGVGKKGEIFNSGLHELYSGASIVGGEEYRYFNDGTLRCRGGASVVFSCEVENDNLIEVRENSVLSVPFLKNLSGAGILTEGIYAVENGSTMILPRDVSILDNAEWKGEGVRKVSEVKGPQSRLTKTSSETHPNALTCSEGATFECEASCITTMPACTFESGAYWVGVGQLTTTTGPTLVRDATVSPGTEEEETGTLTVGGDLEMEEEAVYECEVASDSDHDQIVVETGQVVLGGSYRVVLLGDYAPAIGLSFVILQGTSISGSFDVVDQSELPIGLAPSLTYSTDSVSVSFVPQTLGTYESWKQTRFSPAEQGDVLISGPNADPDGDGQTNAEEYAHGLNPKKSEPSPVEIVAATSNSMDLSFPWATGTEASYQAVTATELTGLLARSSTVLSSVPLEPGVNQTTIRVSFATADEQFGRLEVSLP